MMKKIYHLSNCGTCKKIIEALHGGDGFELQDIKSQPITAEQLDAMKERAGSYEALFSRKAMKYKSMGLAEKTLSEADYRRLILEEYTFLKRPVIVLGEHQFVGNAPKTVAAAMAMLSQS
jgi:arsenate reductase (glutaredoxin)